MRASFCFKGHCADPEKIDKLLTVYAACPTEKILSDLIVEVSKVQLHLCHRYRHLMLRLLVVFRDQRHQVIDDRLTEYCMSLAWFKKTFEKDKSVLKKYFNHFQVLRAVSNEIIITKGSPAEDFYVLIQGSLSAMKQTDPCPEIQKKLRHHKSLSKFEKQDQPKPAKWGCQREIVEGEGFGDVGILYKRRRVATIISNSSSILIKINAVYYIEMCYTSTMAFHEKRYKFILENFSNQIRGIPYDIMQQFLFKFEPVSFSYGNVLLNSTNCQHFLMIDEGTAATYQIFHNKKLRSRTQIKSKFGHGMFVGLDILIDSLNSMSLLPRLSDTLIKKKSLSFNEHSPQIEHYEVVALSSEVTGYRIPKSCLVKFLFLYQNIMTELKERFKMINSYEQSKNHGIRSRQKSQLDERICKEVCITREKYRRMSNLVTRKKSQMTLNKLKL